MEPTSTGAQIYGNPPPPPAPNPVTAINHPSHFFARNVALYDREPEYSNIWGMFKIPHPAVWT